MKKQGEKANLINTKLAQLQQALDEKNKYIDMLEKVIEQAPGNIFWKSKEGKYLGCNNSLAKLLKLKTNTEIIGKTDFDFYSDDLAETLQKTNQEVIATGVEKIFEELGVGTDWQPAIYLSRRMPLTNEDNTIIGIIGVSFDISERKQQEKELQLALERAELAAKAKTDFMAIMSHELRNAIGNIVSALQLATATRKEARVGPHDYLTIAEKTAKDILPFLENVSNYIELESGLIYSKKTPANIVETIRAVVKNNTAAKNKAVSLLFDISTDLPDQLLVDNYNLYKVLDIIISNAIRFTQMGSIIIKAEITDDHYLTVTVTDTGTGISAAQLNNLFNAFPISQEQNARYRKFGLRLSIAKKMLQLIGGDIRVHSEEAKGTQVSITLPYEAVDEMSVPEAKAELAISPLTILVVEDDPVSSEIEVTLLTKLGHRVDAVATGMAAVKQFNQKQYDLIFMDITLSDISGLDATKLIHKKDKAIPIVAITSHSSEEAIDDLLSQGILTVIPKPISQAAFEEFFANYAKLLRDESD
ncbi:MAG: arcB [Gammaproteobacteria bacterium]|jgi:signal transduction histidine kinase|nr:arcB [Gammaproteobacteria bacterium]